MCGLTMSGFHTYMNMYIHAHITTKSWKDIDYTYLDERQCVGLQHATFIRCQIYS